MPAEFFASFSPDDKVPGAYGSVTYGAQGQTAAGLPLLLLLVGLATGGTLTPDTQIEQVFADSDADTYAGPGSELATMVYDAIAMSPDIPIFIASPTPASGAIAASTAITISGTWTGGGTLFVRIGGVSIPVQVNPTDTPANVATNIAAAINGSSSGHLPCSATSAAAIVTIACKTPGVRGDQHIVFLDPSQAPSGCSASLTGAAWAATTAYALGAFVTPATNNGYYYKCTTAGTSAGTAPTFPTTVGTTVTDGTAVWTCWGSVVAKNSTTGVTLGGGSGLETYTNLLSTLFGVGYDRIVVAANDATSAAAWNGQIETQAESQNGFLQHAVFAMNSTSFAPAQALGQTTLNSQRCQVLFFQNSETHPSRIASSMGGLRTNTESADPDASYDGDALTTVAPQSQKSDYPIHSQLVAMLNNSVTPLQTVGGQTVVCRSITSHSLSNGAPDYSTLDTSMSTVPDFVLKQLKLVYTSSVQPNNPRARGPLVGNEPTAPSGVMTPDVWNNTITSNLMDMENGTLPSTAPAPILYNVENALPTTDWDSANKRMESIVPCWPMPGNHQVLLGIAQSS